MTHVDNEPIRSTFANDEDLKDLVSLYVVELPTRMSAMRAALEASNIGEVRRLSHQLRGASAGFGFAVIGQVAGEIEDAIKAAGLQADAIARTRPLVERLSALCDRVAA